LLKLLSVTFPIELQ